MSYNIFWMNILDYLIFLRLVICFFYKMFCKICHPFFFLRIFDFFFSAMNPKNNSVQLQCALCACHNTDGPQDCIVQFSCFCMIIPNKSKEKTTHLQSKNIPILMFVVLYCFQANIKIVNSAHYLCWNWAHPRTVSLADDIAAPPPPSPVSFSQRCGC